MYLKEIYRLSKKNPQIRLTDVANTLSVSKASTNHAVKRLCKEGLLRHATYGLIELTGPGVETARAICEKQKIIVDFLVAKLEIDPLLAAKEACKLEHVVSATVIQKMKQVVETNGQMATGDETC
jgi:Mn-dependent DtxR family transcriptional regulator